MDEQRDRSSAEQALRDPLAALAAAARPTAEAAEVVRRGVRRRRRRRAALAATGAGLGVAAVALAVTVLPGGAGSAGDPRPGPASASPAQTDGAGQFDCPLENRVFRDPPPAVPGLAAQERVAAEVSALVRDVWTVRHAEPTALGVVALVQGNLALAEAQLPEHGVALVRPWAPRPDAAAQVDRALERAVLPVAALVRRASRDLPGGAGIALWPEAGAVVVSWRAPAPPEVLALAGEQRGGVRVVVDEVAWSGEEVREAAVRLWERVRRMPGVELTSAGACGDLSGLVATVTEPLDEARRARLQQRFAEIAGMPVKVVEGEPVVPLGGDVLSD